MKDWQPSDNQLLALLIVCATVVLIVLTICAAINPEILSW